MNLVGAMEMPKRAGLVTMQPAGAAREGLFDLNDVAHIGKRSKSKPWYRGAIDGGDGRIDGRRKVHGRRIIHVVHNGVPHQRRGLEKAELTAKVDGGGGAGAGADPLTERA